MLPVRESLDRLAEELGVHLPALSEDEYLSVAEILVREHGSTYSASFVDLNRIVNRVLDRRRLGEVGGHTVDPGHGNAPASPDDFEIAARAAKVIQLHARRPRHTHPACIAAFTDGLTPCWRCLPILCTDDDCDHDACRYFEAHLDDDDDRREVDA